MRYDAPAGHSTWPLTKTRRPLSTIVAVVSIPELKVSIAPVQPNVQS